MKASQVLDALNTMTRDELRAVAARLNVPRGKDKVNTVSNVATAIVGGDARFTLEFTIREKGIADSTYAPAIFKKKLRTHKPDKVTLPIS